VRDLTLNSTAPSLVYEEGSLIKRSIRDLYNNDIDEVLVAGDDAYREAKDFMRMLMPSHAKNVKPYKEPEPVFIRYQVERQLARRKLELVLEDCAPPPVPVSALYPHGRLTAAKVREFLALLR
jgi:Rne/Rng family ribonuclease